MNTALSKRALFSSEVFSKSLDLCTLGSTNFQIRENCPPLWVFCHLNACLLSVLGCFVFLFFFYECDYTDQIFLLCSTSAVMKTGESGLTVFRLLTKENRWKWVQANARLVYKNGKPDYIIATQRPLLYVPFET